LIRLNFAAQAFSQFHSPFFEKKGGGGGGGKPASTCLLIGVALITWLARALVVIGIFRRELMEKWTRGHSA
jgi:hypothetical protein